MVGLYIYIFTLVLHISVLSIILWVNRVECLHLVHKKMSGLLHNQKVHASKFHSKKFRGESDN